MARDYSSIYNVKDFIANEIATKFYDVEDLAQQNTGLWGMITDISGSSIEDNMRTTSRYITETIPGKARLADFIYAFAGSYGITDVFAHCASVSAILFIKEEDVLKYGTTVGRYTEYVIDSDLVVYVDDIPFSIPADIKIRSTYYNNKYNHRCYYSDNMKNDIVTDDLPYIKCAKMRATEESTNTYLALSVTLFQYVRKRTTQFVIMNSKLNIPTIDVDFDDDLCNFEVFYTAPNSSNKVQLTKRVSTEAPIKNAFVYYELTGENTLRLSFSNDDSYFVPAYNSELEILMYETVGKKGEFRRYTGDNVYVVASSQNPTLDYNNSVSMYCTISGDSTGGRDAYTLEEIRALTDAKRITINSYTTDNDLDVYFGAYTPLYDSYAKFIKHRDDLATRIYQCYTRLRDSEIIFPTNTIDLSIKLTDLDNEYDPEQNQMIIASGRRIGYADIIDSGYTKTNTDECRIYPNDVEELPIQDIEYTTFGLMRITKNPTSIAFFMNSIDKSIPIKYDYVNDDSLYQFIVRNLYIKRNAPLGEDTYDVTLNIIPSDLSLIESAIYEPYDAEDDEYAGTDDETGTIPEDEEEVLNIANIEVYIIIRGGEYYMKMDYQESLSSDENGYVYSASIGTTDIINSENIELDGFTSVESQHVQKCYVAMENPDMVFVIFYNEGTKPGHAYDENSVNQIPAMFDYTLTNTFTLQDDEMYFAYPLSLIRPTVTFEQDTTNPAGFSMHVTGLPVVGRDFILDSDYYKEFLDRLNSQHKFLEDVTITSNYAIHMKFYNTYGRSRTFTITDGSLLNRVNCDLDLGIHFVQGVEYTEYINAIKITIKEYIETVNTVDVSTGINSIKLSVLIQKMHEAYPDIIDYIIMNSLNTYTSDIQTIIMPYDLSSSDNKDRIPEFLTINIEDIKITVL